MMLSTDTRNISLARGSCRQQQPTDDKISMPQFVFLNKTNRMPLEPATDGSVSKRSPRSVVALKESDTLPFDFPMALPNLKNTSVTRGRQEPRAIPQLNFRSVENQDDSPFSFFQSHFRQDVQCEALASTSIKRGRRKREDEHDDDAHDVDDELFALFHMDPEETSRMTPWADKPTSPLLMTPPRSKTVQGDGKIESRVEGRRASTLSTEGKSPGSSNSPRVSISDRMDSTRKLNKSAKAA